MCVCVVQEVLKKIAEKTGSESKYRDTGGGAIEGRAVAGTSMHEGTKLQLDRFYARHNANLKALLARMGAAGATVVGNFDF